MNNQELNCQKFIAVNWINSKYNGQKEREITIIVNTQEGKSDEKEIFSRI
ncbi:MAG: hypothetical protein QNJ31_09515 [Candidatus Caenarcaniphilales bacterium]|nr:hypothetical protein [Candidatus Caenarcaniphilales bacterium]